MNILKNKNIFNNFEYSKNNLSIKNIITYFGKRIIDLLAQMPVSINKNNLINEFKVKNIETIISCDLLINKYEKKFNKRSPFKVITENKKKQKVEILFFNMYENQIKNYLKLQRIYRITGKLNWIDNKFVIVHPTTIFDQNELFYYDLYEPQYDLSRKRINKRIFRKIIKNNIESFKLFNFPNEWILNKFKKKQWCSFKETLLQIHIPQTSNDLQRLEKNRTRLAFDELLSSYLTFYELKKKIRLNSTKSIISNYSLSKKIKQKLPFELTEDQSTALNDIRKDLSKSQQMYRLIQGDVGSGKTIIALLAIAETVKCGLQTVLMAPTEILAKQHYDYFKKLLSPFNIKTEILTGKTKTKKIIYERLSNGDIDILIGTHSVYNSSIIFKNLGLIVIDEQHKFGVKQRINLLEKSVGCHTLIMSATPIPRSLSFAIYGEISISNIKSKPKGRKKVITSIISLSQTDKLLHGIQRKLDKDEQIFWVLPTIGTLDSEEQTLITRFEFLKQRFNKKVGFVHGKMKKEDINEVMQNFKDKKIMILVSTTVIEVGINIPNATLIVIENAERFGLSQLHQLRGRVSRSNLNSDCVLIHNRNLSEITKQRLLILKNNDDGFEIAEKDLYLRGAGDFFGTNQSGLPSWKFFKPYLDYKLLKNVKENSEYLINNYDSNKDKIKFLQKTFYNEKSFKNYFSV
tara:strand:- start:692 stop:2758 length:2067 start_codon:yes stop_codon:yes gene_type:complete